jgi:hypothetical protein
MKRLLTFAAALAVVSPLFAAEPKTKTKEPAKEATKTASSTTVTILAQPQVRTGDSPLVAAAKRSRRTAGKSSIIITNDNLVTTGGHFTTTARQAPIPIIGGGGPAEARQNHVPERAEPTRIQQPKPDPQAGARMQTEYEGDPYTERDPSQVEHQLQQQPPAPKKP